MAADWSIFEPPHGRTNSKAKRASNSLLEIPNWQTGRFEQACRLIVIRLGGNGEIRIKHFQFDFKSKKIEVWPESLAERCPLRTFDDFLLFLARSSREGLFANRGCYSPTSFDHMGHMIWPPKDGRSLTWYYGNSANYWPEANRNWNRLLDVSTAKPFQPYRKVLTPLEKSSLKISE